MRLHLLEEVAKLHEGYRRVFDVGGRRLLLLQHAGQVYLLDNICPHAGYPLEAGRINEAGEIRCPMHGYLFDLNSGECTYSTEGPCRAVETFALQRQGDWIGVELEEA